MKKIVIDCGHTRDFAREHPSQFTGIDWGKGDAKTIADILGFNASTDDSLEHMLNVKFGNILAKKLQAEVVDWPWMTNNAEISKVINHVNSTKADLLVSIHANAAGQSSWVRGKCSASGTVVLYHPSSKGGKQLARDVADACKVYRKLNGGPDNRFDTISPSTVAVLSKTHCPAILIELCFYDNLDDLLWTVEHLDGLADAVIKGLG